MPYVSGGNVLHFRPEGVYLTLCDKCHACHLQDFPLKQQLQYKRKTNKCKTWFQTRWQERRAVQAKEIQVEGIKACFISELNKSKQRLVLKFIRTRKAASKPACSSTRQAFTDISQQVAIPAQFPVTGVQLLRICGHHAPRCLQTFRPPQTVISKFICKKWTSSGSTDYLDKKGGNKRRARWLSRTWLEQAELHALPYIVTDAAAVTHTICVHGFSNLSIQLPSKWVIVSGREKKLALTTVNANKWTKGVYTE